jgi:hypothetical protein
VGLSAPERVQEGRAPGAPGEGSGEGAEAPPARRYAVRPENPEGVPEDPTRCREEVWAARGFTTHQCTRPRGFGLDLAYCSIHAKPKTNLTPFRELPRRLKRGRK